MSRKGKTGTTPPTGAARTKDSPESSPGPGSADARRSTPRDKLPLPERRRNSPSGVKDSAAQRKDPAGARNDSAGAGDRAKNEASPWHLNIRAVDELVNANEQNSPPVSRAEMKKYRSGPRIRLADWVKALILKWWAGGMICYFFIWGLSTFAMNPWDQLAVLGIALGLVTNLIVNNIYRFIAREKGAYDRWMMFPGKKIWFLPLDLIYALVLVFCTELTYQALNRLLGGSGAEGAPVLGVEPILFGLFILIWDLIFLGMKHLGRRILEDAGRQAGNR